MRILLLGARGQVGWQLRRSLSVVGQTTALDRSSRDHCGDLLNHHGIAATIHQIQPHVIVNAAAWTAVDKAESEPDAAMAANAWACETIAKEAAALNAWVIHYSTDYVYPGTGNTPWVETDPTAPVNTYGRSKLAGEQLIQKFNARHIIFRTSWVFDTWGQNFLKTILRLAQTRDTLNVVGDQWGAPTRAALIADITAHVIRTLTHANADGLAGIYHLAAQGHTSWHAYAQELVSAALDCKLPIKARPELIHPVSTSAYPTPAARPANSRLDTHKLQNTFELSLPHWTHGVRTVVSELAEQIQKS